MTLALDWQPYVLLAGLFIILLSLLRAMRRRYQTQARPEPRRRGTTTARPAPAAARANRDIQRSMEQLLVELHAVSRDINAQLDTKMRALTQLTDQARREADRLERLLAQADRTGTADRAPSMAPSAPETATVPAGAPEDPRRRQIFELADAGLSTVLNWDEIGRRSLERIDGDLAAAPGDAHLLKEKAEVLGFRLERHDEALAVLDSVPREALAADPRLREDLALMRSRIVTARDHMRYLDME